MTQSTEQERAEFEAWSQANNKYHVSGYNPHNDLWESWQAARRAPVVPQEGLHRIRILLRVAKNQINKATMSHAISVVQDELEKVALAASPQPPEAAPVELPEPAEFQVRIRPTWNAYPHWTIWEKCTPEAAADYERTPLLHEWEYEVRKLYTERQVRQLLAAHGIQEQST